jgi:hypothetical protein
MRWAPHVSDAAYQSMERKKGEKKKGEKGRETLRGLYIDEDFKRLE